MRRGRYLNCTRGFVYLSLNAWYSVMFAFYGKASTLMCLHVKARASSAKENIDAHIAEREVERLLRKMLLKLTSTMYPITVHPSMQFLVFILLSWRAGMHQEAFKRHGLA